jgi:hypothetical protein
MSDVRFPCEQAVKRARGLTCSACKRKGATIGCYQRKCKVLLLLLLPPSLSRVHV